MFTKVAMSTILCAVLLVTGAAYAGEDGATGCKSCSKAKAAASVTFTSGFAQHPDYCVNPKKVKEVKARNDKPPATKPEKKVRKVSKEKGTPRVCPGEISGFACHS